MQLIANRGRFQGYIALATLSGWSLDFITPDKVLFEGRPIEVDTMISVLTDIDRMEQTYLSTTHTLNQIAEKNTKEPLINDGRASDLRG